MPGFEQLFNMHGFSQLKLAAIMNFPINYSVTLFRHASRYIFSHFGLQKAQIFHLCYVGSLLQCYQCKAYHSSDNCKSSSQVKKLCPNGFTHCSNGTTHVYFYSLSKNLTAHWQECSTERQCRRKICPDFWGELGRILSCTMDCCNTDFCPEGNATNTVKDVSRASSLSNSLVVISISVNTVFKLT